MADFGCAVAKKTSTAEPFGKGLLGRVLGKLEHEFRLAYEGVRQPRDQGVAVFLSLETAGQHD